MRPEWVRFERHRETFTQTIDVTKVMPQMSRSDAFTLRDEETLMSEPRPRQRAVKLLEMVERRGPLALDAFMEAIGEYYPHLYMLLIDDEEDDYGGNYSLKVRLMTYNNIYHVKRGDLIFPIRLLGTDYKLALPVKLNIKITYFYSQMVTSFPYLPEWK